LCSEQSYSKDRKAALQKLASAAYSLDATGGRGSNTVTRTEYGEVCRADNKNAGSIELLSRKSIVQYLQQQVSTYLAVRSLVAFYVSLE